MSQQPEYFGKHDTGVMCRCGLCTITDIAEADSTVPSTMTETKGRMPGIKHRFVCYGCAASYDTAVFIEIHRYVFKERRGRYVA